jgi:hypothetical protein
MRITSLRRPTTETTARSGSRPATGARFQLADSGPQGTAVSGRSAAVAHIGSLIALQSATDEEARTRRAIGQGRDLLGLLDDLKLALLSGGPLAGKAANIERTLAAVDAYDGDPALKDLLDQIDLRARVELAKLRKSGA